VPDTARDLLLAEADALVGTSVREGWGLTVVEAALVGTPAVVYDIPGFRDSVVHERTGVVTPRDPSSLAEGIRWLLADRSRYEIVRAAARERTAATSWDATAVAFERVLEAAVTGSARG